jgi:hypothetical protein
MRLKTRYSRTENEVEEFLCSNSNNGKTSYDHNIQDLWKKESSYKLEAYKTYSMKL